MKKIVIVVMVLISTLNLVGCDNIDSQKNIEKDTITLLNTENLETLSYNSNKDVNYDNNSEITEEDAINLLKNYLNNNNLYVPSIIDISYEENNDYVIHCYDIVENHTSTSGWYYLNKNSGDIRSMF